MWELGRTQPQQPPKTLPKTHQVVHVCVRTFRGGSLRASCRRFAASNMAAEKVGMVRYGVSCMLSGNADTTVFPRILASPVSSHSFSHFLIGQLSGDGGAW